MKPRDPELFEAAPSGDDSLARIYRERAASLARREVDESARTKGCSVVVFQMGAERHGLPMSAVERIFARPILTPAPGVGPRWAGVFAVQGEIVPILHLARILNMPDADPDSDQYVLSLRTAGRKLGLLVERVLQIHDIRLEGLRPAASQTRYLKGISPDGELILDIDLLVEQEFSQ